MKLTKIEHTQMVNKLAAAKSRKNITRKIDKKYLTRDSPPYPANEHCGEKKKRQ